MSLKVAGMIDLVRTKPFRTGSFGVLYLPNGRSVHTLEDLPIPLGVYFLRPDDTGRFRHYVVETLIGSRVAVPPLLDDRGNVLRSQRDAVEMHPGPAEGVTTLLHTDGCMCPGMETTAVGVTDGAIAMGIVRESLGRDRPDPPSWVLRISGGAA